MRSKSAITFLASSSLCVKSAALLWYPLALTPYFSVNSASKALAFSTELANVKAILQPFLANVSAIPLPIPLVAPVIRADFPFNIKQRYLYSLTESIASNLGFITLNHNGAIKLNTIMPGYPVGI